MCIRRSLHPNRRFQPTATYRPSSLRKSARRSVCSSPRRHTHLYVPYGCMCRVRVCRRSHPLVCLTRAALRSRRARKPATSSLSMICAWRDSACSRACWCPRCCSPCATGASCSKCRPPTPPRPLPRGAIGRPLPCRASSSRFRAARHPQTPQARTAGVVPIRAGQTRRGASPTHSAARRSSASARPGCGRGGSCGALPAGREAAHTRVPTLPDAHV